MNDTLPADIQPFSGRFLGTTHVFALRVYFEDTDFSGIVYHANYLRYCERARSDMLRAIGIDQRGAFEEGGGVYAVADLHIHYVRPAKLEDDLVVLSEVTEVRAASCHIHQRVMRRRQEAGAAVTLEPIADARVTAAFLAPSGRPTRQPKAWVQAFRSVLANPDDTKDPQ